MLGVFCSRPKPLILNSYALFANGFSVHVHHNSRRVTTPIHHFSRVVAEGNRRRCHSVSCEISACGGAASIWHAILPSSNRARGLGRWIGPKIFPERKGEGSWNVAWDARPARWLHRPDSAWLLFGVCACLVPGLVPVVDEKIDGSDSISTGLEERHAWSSPGYKVTGVLADGRCLFRAIVHGACLRRGEAAPDENRQTQLADELRAQVVDELLKRREESEWFIEGDFDAYVQQIQQPYVWGGEPELLMASHVLKSKISVFMGDRSSGNLMKIADYGQEYQKEEESAINLLFHGYGHYELLEDFSEGSKLMVNA